MIHKFVTLGSLVFASISAFASPVSVSCRFEDNSLAAKLNIDAQARTVSGGVFYADDARQKYKSFPVEPRLGNALFTDKTGIIYVFTPAVLQYAALGSDFQSLTLNMEVPLELIPNGEFHTTVNYRYVDKYDKLIQGYEQCMSILGDPRLCGSEPVRPYKRRGARFPVTCNVY